MHPTNEGGRSGGGGGAETSTGEVVVEAPDASPSSNAATDANNDGMATTTNVDGLYSPRRVSVCKR
ncbi:hypothetical protein ZHAS_00013104 [Anopheles sinensis]|uniref:Uncharacterized protein n=1 Tax=Anopheles sinensis TaxID=74873 RepID=A0A084W4K5_ANOSI|nr:hypothetical protein ZHAS_00013104 [Anopheles sinensis]